MTVSRRHLLSAALGGTAALGLGYRGAKAAAPLGVGFVYDSPIGSAGWTFQHDLGRRAVEATFGAAVRTSVIESATGEAAAPAILRLASTNRLIVTTASGFADAARQVARLRPGTDFETCMGRTPAINLGTYSARFYEGRYLAGMVSAALSRTGHLGHVASFPTPAVVQGINALALGAQAVNPDARVTLVWTNAWFDPVGERAAAKALIAQGCDVLSSDCGSPAVNAAAEAAGIWNTGSASDMRSVAPQTCLFSVIDDWCGYYRARVGAALRGDWVADAVWGGLDGTMIRTSAYNEVVGDHVVQRVEARKAAIALGIFAPFQGPIRDRAGRLRVRAGARLGDSGILAMDWLVRGIAGGLDNAALGTLAN
jgi:basic membrane protein A